MLNQWELVWGGGRTIRQQANFFHRRHNLIQEYRG